MSTTKNKKIMEEITVPKYVLEGIENTLRLWANTHNSYSRETCLDRDTICYLSCTRKLLKGKEITGRERTEKLEDY